MNSDSTEDSAGPIELCAGGGVVVSPSSDASAENSDWSGERGSWAVVVVDVAVVRLA